MRWSWRKPHHIIPIIIIIIIITIASRRRLVPHSLTLNIMTRAFALRLCSTHSRPHWSTLRKSAVFPLPGA